jgi:hypothetical protein
MQVQVQVQVQLQLQQQIPLCVAGGPNNMAGKKKPATTLGMTGWCVGAGEARGVLNFVQMTCLSFFCWEEWLPSTMNCAKELA